MKWTSGTRCTSLSIPARPLADLQRSDEQRNAKSMAKYLISFPSAALVVPDGKGDAAVCESHAVIWEAKQAGVYVFGKASTKVFRRCYVDGR
jgi:hypothetical protein